MSGDIAALLLYNIHFFAMHGCLSLYHNLVIVKNFNDYSLNELKFEFDCFFSTHVCYNFFYFIGAANIAVFWYTIVWLKLISYVSVNLWYRLGLMKHEEKGKADA